MYLWVKFSQMKLSPGDVCYFGLPKPLRIYLPMYHPSMYLPIRHTYISRRHPLILTGAPPYPLAHPHHSGAHCDITCTAKTIPYHHHTPNSTPSHTNWYTIPHHFPLCDLCILTFSSYSLYYIIRSTSYHIPVHTTISYYLCSLCHRTSLPSL